MENNNIKEQAILLYKDGFDDSKEFCDFFFSNIYDEKKFYYTTLENKLVSCLHIVDKYICTDYDKNIIYCPYLVAVSTLTAFRGKGIVHKVIKNALENIKITTPIVALSPFSHRYYEKFGFTTIDYAKKQTISYIKKGGCISSYNTSIEELYDFYVQNSHSSEVSIFRNKDIFMLKHKENLCEKDTHIIALYQNSELVGFAYLNSKYKEIAEYYIKDGVVLDNYIELDGYSFTTPCVNGKENTMARILNPTLALEKYQFPHNAKLNVKLTIVDSFLGDEVLYLHIKDSTCNITKTPIWDTYTSENISIFDLTKLYFGIVEEKKNISTFTQLFKRKSTFLVDKY